MLNYIWLGLILLAVILGGCLGNLEAVTDKSFELAKYAVLDTAFPLLGIMALWLGMMRVAERAGLVTMLARGLRPVMRWLFPDVPPEHPAMGSMVLNIAANMLGLGNAATPLGLRAMRDLNSLNPRPGTPTNAMCMFLAINTSSVQLIPVTAIAILAANQSKNPTAIVGTSILATACAALSAVTMAKLLARLPMFRLPPLASAATTRGAEPSRSAPEPKPIEVPLTPALSPLERERENGRQFSREPRLAERSGKHEPPTKPSADQSQLRESAVLPTIQAWGVAILIAFGLFFFWLFVKMAFPAALGYAAPPDSTNQPVFIRIVDAISKLSVPFLLSFFPLYAALRRQKVYEDFVDGAKEGFEVAIRIIPYLVAILVGIGMFRASGGIDMLRQKLGPAMLAVGFPPDLLPLVLMRPLSGSGTLGVFTELVKNVGPDSLVARTAGTIYGSTETTFYVLAVYFGSVGVKKARYALFAGLTADFIGVVASVVICRLVFS
jgi:spore maturation protein SpmA